jgi:hypothetical protein
VRRSEHDHGRRCRSNAATASPERRGLRRLGPGRCERLPRLGHISGALSCAADCTYDVSHCTILWGPFVTRSFKVTGLTKPRATRRRR